MYPVKLINIRQLVMLNIPYYYCHYYLTNQTNGEKKDNTNYHHLAK